MYCNAHVATIILKWNEHQLKHVAKRRSQKFAHTINKDMADFVLFILFCANIASQEVGGQSTMI